MGLREKARKSLQPDATADEVEQNAPMLLELEAAEREAEATTQQLRKRDAAVEAKEASMRKRGVEVESLAAANDGREKERTQRERSLSMARDKLDAETRVIREANREVEAARAKLEAREAEIAGSRKKLQDEAHARISKLERELDAGKKDLAKMQTSLDAARGEATSARKEFQEKEIVLTTEMTKALGAAGQEKEKTARLREEIDDLRKRAGKAGELSEKESSLKAQWAKLNGRTKKLADREATLTGLKARLEAREAEAHTAARIAADRTGEAENALKAVKERERIVEKAEKKFVANEDKLAEQTKAKDEAHARALDETRTLLRSRDRDLAKRAKARESLKAHFRSANEARERREADVKTELTRTKDQVKAEARRSSGLEKDLGAA